MFIGAHMSISGGIEKAPLRGAEIGCNAIQIFTKSSNRWDARPLEEKEIAQFKENTVKAGIKKVVAHDCYLINLASPDDTLHKKSCGAFLIEMQRAEALGISCLVFHPGNHMGKGIDHGIKKIAWSLNSFISKTKGYKLILAVETTAGQGTSVGHEFGSIKKIMEMVDDKKRIGICIDTCHIFAAGYDIKSEKGYKNTFKQVKDIFGIEKIKAFHLNDSKNDLGSRKDRHEHIGEGFLGLEPFGRILNDARFKNIPMILETPKGPTMNEDKANLATLRKLKS